MPWLNNIPRLEIWFSHPLCALYGFLFFGNSETYTAEVINTLKSKVSLNQSKITGSNTRFCCFSLNPHLHLNYKCNLGQNLSC